MKKFEFAVTVSVNDDVSFDSAKKAVTELLTNSELNVLNVAVRGTRNRKKSLLQKLADKFAAKEKTVRAKPKTLLISPEQTIHAAGGNTLSAATVNSEIDATVTQAEVPSTPTSAIIPDNAQPPIMM